MPTLKRLFSILLFSLFLTTASPLLCQESPGYSVAFNGNLDSNTLELIKEASLLMQLQDHPPKTEASLKRRAEQDVPNIVKALHSLAHYDAVVEFDIAFDNKPAEVTFNITPGPVYTFGSVEVTPDSIGVRPEELGICLGRTALPRDIFSAEEALIFVMERKGYPLAQLKEREVVADQKTKEIHIVLNIDSGPKARFGDIKITGNENVKDLFIRKKVFWRDGSIYDPSQIERTMSALESAGVFSYIGITHDDAIDTEGYLPMTIHVNEGKQRSIGMGIGYSTQRGPGVTAEWEHRNFHGMGEKLRVDANVLKETQEGSVSYLIPDFIARGQDLLWKAEVEHDDTKGYEKTSFTLSEILEKQVNPCLRLSIGGEYEYLRTTEEKESGKKNAESYNLARVPMKIKWSTVDDPLDPGCGASLFLKAVPTFQLFGDPFGYTITTLSASIYKPMSKEGRWIVAAKASVSSILGSSRSTIPGSERLYAGSESTLRGYNYYTVGPLSDDLDPIGGRSMMIYTAESRWKLTDNWGAVLFYDVGNVFSDPYPKFDEKLLQSVGIGIRYFTPVGPLRLDIAVPLDRRRKFDRKEMKDRYVDDPYQIYFSIGQSF